MNIYISKNIRHYRTQKKLTQEELADFLGVSFQAVSKWERALAYPDIETIPVIANFFNITIDELMGNSRIHVEERICEYLKKYDELTLLCTKEKDSEKNALAKKAYAEFPYDWRIINMYRNSLLCGRDADDYGDTKPTISFLCKKILEDCTNDYFRQCAVSSLLAISETPEEEEKWLSLLNDDFCLLRGERREDIAFERGRFGEALKYCQINLMEYLGWFLMKIDTLKEMIFGTDERKISPEQKIMINNKVIGILEILFECEDFGEWTWNIAAKYEENARIFFSLGKSDDGLTAFIKSVDYWLRYDALPKKTLYTSVLFNSSEFIKNDIDTADAEYKKPKRYFNIICSDSVYDCVRQDERFIAAVNRLMKNDFTV